MSEIIRYNGKRYRVIAKSISVADKKERWGLADEDGDSRAKNITWVDKKECRKKRSEQ